MTTAAAATKREAPEWRPETITELEEGVGEALLEALENGQPDPEVEVDLGGLLYCPRVPDGTDDERAEGAESFALPWCLCGVIVGDGHGRSACGCRDQALCDHPQQTHWTAYLQLESIRAWTDKDSNVDHVCAVYWATL